jgi:hypothetical protein
VTVAVEVRAGAAVAQAVRGSREPQPRGVAACRAVPEISGDLDENYLYGGPFNPYI